MALSGIQIGILLLVVVIVMPMLYFYFHPCWKETAPLTRRCELSIIRESLQKTPNNITLQQMEARFNNMSSVDFDKMVREADNRADVKTPENLKKMVFQMK